MPISSSHATECKSDTCLVRVVESFVQISRVANLLRLSEHSSAVTSWANNHILAVVLHSGFRDCHLDDDNECVHYRMDRNHQRITLRNENRARRDELGAYDEQSHCLFIFEGAPLHHLGFAVIGIFCHENGLDIRLLCQAANKQLRHFFVISTIQL